MAHTILVIDDEPGVRQALARSLRRRGYAVLEAASAEEGVGILAMTCVHGVITDQCMPGMSGLELCRLLRTSHPRLRPILLSGGFAEPALQGEPLGQLLPKPWSDEELHRALGEAIAWGLPEAGILPQH
jgi:CheY-like chemotaxis protein